METIIMQILKRPLGYKQETRSNKWATCGHQDNWETSRGQVGNKCKQVYISRRQVRGQLGRKRRKTVKKVGDKGGQL